MFILKRFFKNLYITKKGTISSLLGRYSKITWRALEAHSKGNRRELEHHFGIQKAFEKHLGTQGTETLEYLKSTWEIETLRHSSIWRARWYLDTEAFKALFSSL